MNEVLKEIIISYLPAIASVGGTTVAAIFIRKFVIGVVKSLKEKVDEAAELRHEVAKLNKRISEEVESNRQLKEKIENFSLQVKGIDPNEVKKRLSKN